MSTFSEKVRATAKKYLKPTEPLQEEGIGDDSPPGVTAAFSFSDTFIAIKSKFENVERELKSPFEKFKTKFNAIDHFDDDDNGDDDDHHEDKYSTLSGGVPETSPAAAPTTTPPTEEYYFGKAVVDFKRNLRESALQSRLQEERRFQEEEQRATTSSCKLHSLTLFDFSYSTSNPVDASVYVLFSVENETFTSSRRSTAGGSTHWKNSLTRMELSDLFADLYVSVFQTKKTDDILVGRAILPLSSLFPYNMQTLCTPSKRTVQQRFTLTLLPLSFRTRMYTRSEDGLNIGLNRPQFAGFVTFTVRIDSSSSFLKALITQPPLRTLAGPAYAEENFKPEVLATRRFRLERIVQTLQTISFWEPLLDWHDVRFTVGFLFWFFALVFFAEAFQLPLFLSLFVCLWVAFQRELRKTVVVSRIPVFQNEVLAEHPEVPNTMPQQLRAMMKLATMAQFLLGRASSALEMALISWQDDVLVSTVLCLTVMIVGILASYVWWAMMCFPLLWKLPLFAFVLVMHVPRFRANWRNNHSGGGGAVSKHEGGMRFWAENFGKRIPDAREIEHRKIAEFNRVAVGKLIFQ